MENKFGITVGTLNELSAKFNIFTSLAKYLDNSEDKDLIKKRENRMNAAKVYEHIIAYILGGKVAEGVGYDIYGSEWFPDKKIEVKSTIDTFYCKDGTPRKSKIIVTNKFKPNNKIDLKSDIFIINSLGSRQSLIVNSNDIAPIIKISGAKLMITIDDIFKCNPAIIDWPDYRAMTKTCYRNLYAESVKLDNEKNIKEILDTGINGVSLSDIKAKFLELVELITEYVKSR